MLTAYADEHVKAPIVEGLRRRGVDIVTAQERGQRQTDDEILLATATAENRVFLTNDTDFLRIHGAWMAAGRSHAGIVYWPQGRPIGEAIRRIHQHLLQSAPDDTANVVKFT
jgi:hypothetical protein